MGYKGVMKGGAVVLKDAVDLPEGAEVVVEAPSILGQGLAGLLSAPSLDEAIERLRFLYKVHRGIQQADAGETLSHEEAAERLGQWLT